MAEYTKYRKKVSKPVMYYSIVARRYRDGWLILFGVAVGYGREKGARFFKAEDVATRAELGEDLHKLAEKLTGSVQLKIARS